MDVYLTTLAAVCSKWGKGGREEGKEVKKKKKAEFYVDIFLF